MIHHIYLIHIEINQLFKCAEHKDLEHGFHTFTAEKQLTFHKVAEEYTN